MLFVMVCPCCEKDEPDSNENWTVGDDWIDPRDGQSYATVQIGDQVWMAENQAYEGAGQQISDDVDWAENSNYDGWCYYGDNKAKYGCSYGFLYQWEVAKEVCPSGWHLTSDAEWTELTDYLDGESVAGGIMKESGTAHWNSPNTGATHGIGFNALPGGYLAYYGSNFGFMRYSAFFWSSTEYNSSHAMCHRLYHNNSEVVRESFFKRSGFSVRCV
jgi:uncharacterized protein (TIGR02145 family)